MYMLMNFSNSGQFALDTCAGAFSTTNTFMMLPKHCDFVKCEIEGECYNQSSLAVVDTFSEQAPNNDYDVTVSEGVVDAVKVFVGAMDCIALEARYMILESFPQLTGV